MSHGQMFELTDQLFRSTGKTSKKYNGTTRRSILYKFLKIDVSIIFLF